MNSEHTYYKQGDKFIDKKSMSQEADLSNNAPELKQRVKFKMAKLFHYRPKLLPILMVVLFVVLTYRVGHVSGFDYLFGSASDNALIVKDSAFAQSNDTENDNGITATQNQEEQVSNSSIIEGSDTQSASALDQGENAYNQLEKEINDIANLTPEEIKILHKLNQRRKVLDARERSVTERFALLEAAEISLNNRHTELEDAEDKLKKLIARYENIQGAETLKLQKIYSSMKAKKAAEIFNGMDIKSLVGIVTGMKARDLSLIMAVMDSDKARELTLYIAERDEVPELPEIE